MIVWAMKLKNVTQFLIKRARSRHPESKVTKFYERYDENVL